MKCENLFIQFGWLILRITTFVSYLVSFQVIFFLSSPFLFIWMMTNRFLDENVKYKYAFKILLHSFNSLAVIAYLSFLPAPISLGVLKAQNKEHWELCLGLFVFSILYCWFWICFREVLDDVDFQVQLEFFLENLKEEEKKIVPEINTPRPEQTVNTVSLIEEKNTQINGLEMNIKRLTRENKGMAMEIHESEEKIKNLEKNINSLFSMNKKLTSEKDEKTNTCNLAIQEIQGLRIKEELMLREIAQLKFQKASQEPNECSICSIAYDSGQHATSISKICGHILCKRCLEQIQQNTGRCPFCNKPYQLTDILPVFGDL
ncbi:Oidioi.mRNA.OKI2018_I69.chr1.g810.t1.cds [Oikopleura dioica]|uniref:Oidioi.mRNA.OKI2018_I69.chr1.g810.t1.cds n=1 Tax=Oikopleura dioica TaxID=34765 RepID=A0ABN7SMR6_OIKDI|nr:Oidioi.mRNA.OKI2018_I69.chr1.g810.t1.cds [Oikopleura dioica]